jgi:hypothetical protein
LRGTVLTVDNGINAQSVVRLARRLGVEVIVIDSSVQSAGAPCAECDWQALRHNSVHHYAVLRMNGDYVEYAMRDELRAHLNSTLAQFPVRVLQCEFGLLLNPRSGAIVNVPLPFPSITSNVGSSSSP